MGVPRGPARAAPPGSPMTAKGHTSARVGSWVFVTMKNGELTAGRENLGTRSPLEPFGTGRDGERLLLHRSRGPARNRTDGRKRYERTAKHVHGYHGWTPCFCLPRP